MLIMKIPIIIARIGSFSTARMTAPISSSIVTDCILLAPFELNGSRVDIIQDPVQDLFLNRGWRILGVAFERLNLTDYVSYIGHGKFPAFLLSSDYQIARVRIYIRGMERVVGIYRTGDESNLEVI